MVIGLAFNIHFVLNTIIKTNLNTPLVNATRVYDALLEVLQH